MLASFAVIVPLELISPEEVIEPVISKWSLNIIPFTSPPVDWKLLA